MSDLYHKAGAVTQARFRENTAKRAVMAGGYLTNDAHCGGLVDR